MDNKIKNYNLLQNENDELERTEKNLQQQINALENPNSIHQLFTDLQESIPK